MRPDRWARIEELFTGAAELESGARSAFLAAAAGDDVELRAEVESLLAEHDRDPAFLERPAWAAAAYPDPRGHLAELEKMPARIGAYTILGLLGDGGMGRVYLAEREAPGFRQRVALKVMRRGLDTDHLIQRFRNERQILATLNHPNIARLLDVGATDSGLPFFVMEHVEGDSIVDHCDRRRLGLAHRLQLFRTVCATVHHAHQNLVVHRDLKPSNILITDAGVPKLLDFGIAKILDPERSGIGSATTRAGERLLTPEYSAPEQVRGDVVTTACDVYALGVLLYELLTGRHPHEPARRQGPELARRVLETDPPPPSAVVAEGLGTAERARARSTTPDPLRRALAGDLDTIVLTALRREPEERYPSALALADDIRRHLDGLPVEARPATVGYRLRKFARRNRTAVAGGVLLILLLAGFSGVTAHQSRRIRAESARVTRERDKAVEVRAFLLETFGSTGPDQVAGATVPLRALLDGRAATIAEAYTADPELQAEMMMVLAESYERLGLYAEADPLARKGLAVRRELFGGLHPDVAGSLNLLGWVLWQRGQTEDAEPLLEDAVRIGRAVFPASGDARLARTLNDLGVVREARGDYAAAEALYRESLDMRSRLLGEAHPGVAVTTSNLAVVLYRQADLAGAAAMAARAVESFRRALGPDHQRTAVALGNLAAIQSVRGDRQAAAEVYGQILERHRRVLGPRHEQTAYALMMRANQLVPLGRHEEAEPLLLGALDIYQEVFGPNHERIDQGLRVLGDVQEARGDWAGALDRFLAAHASVRTRVGDTHQEVATLELRAARMLHALQRPRDAEPRFRRAVRTFQATAGPSHYFTANATLSLAEFLAREGRPDEAAAVAAELGPTLQAGDDAFDAIRERLETLRADLRAAGH